MATDPNSVYPPPPPYQMPPPEAVEYKHPQQPPPPAPAGVHGQPVHHMHNQVHPIQQQPQPHGSTNVVIIQQQATGRPNNGMPSMTGHIIFSCFTFCCCNPICGGIAFILAIVGLNASSPEEAKRLGIGSLALNIIAMISSVLVAIILVVLVFTLGLFTYDDSYYDPYNYVNNYDNWIDYTNNDFTSYTNCFFDEYGDFVC